LITRDTVDRETPLSLAICSRFIVIMTRERSQVQVGLFCLTGTGRAAFLAAKCGAFGNAPYVTVLPHKSEEPFNVTGVGP
jgi:hypothetical protein